MKGFTRDHKFVPMTDYKKVRKSRDPEAKTQGVRLKRTAKVKAVNLVPTELLNHPMFEEGSEWLDILAENPKVIVPDKKQNVFWIWFGGESRNFHEVQPNGHTADTFSYGGDRATENITPKEAVKIIEELELNPEKVRKKRDEQVITIDGHSTNIPASPDSTEDEDRYVEETVRIGLIKRRQALALIKRSPKGIDQTEIREILGSEALPEIRVLTDIDKTVVEKDGIFKVAKK